jgi:hypothetical protein
MGNSEKLSLREVKDKKICLVCELEQGSILGEGDGEDVDERSDKSLMDYVESSKQHEDVLKEESTEVREPYVFELDILCMIAGYAGARQPFTASIMMGRNE